MAVGDKTTDPVTGEPEIELADGSKVTDWESLQSDPNRQLLPLGVGVVVPHFAATVPDGGWLPMSNGVFNDVDYPVLAAAIAAGNTVGSDLGDGTFRLLDLNGALNDGRGRVFEGLGTQTPGELQNDATAVNGLRIAKSYVQADWHGMRNNDVSKGSNSNITTDSQSLSSSDLQTRAPAVSALWMVRAKPFDNSVVPLKEIGSLKPMPNVKEDGTAKTSDDHAADGLLPLANGFRLTDGATDNPKFALMFPTFVSGNDLLVPSTFDGAFIRNLGGNAAAFMAFQDDATAVNGLHDNGHVHSIDLAHNESQSGQVGTNGSNWQQRNTNTGFANLDSTDPETRPANFAMQFCLVLDTYIGAISITNARTATAGQTLTANGDGTFTFRT